mgnify:CR=1 FL=1
MKAPRRSGFPLGELAVFFAASLLAGGSGLALAFYRYLARPEDPFTPVHPALPFWQHFHVLVVPALVLLLGVAWARHVHSSWASGKPRRTSGGALGLLSLAMVFSGPWCQTATSSGSRQLAGLLHTISGVVWLLLLLFHALQRVKNGR